MPFSTFFPGFCLLRFFGCCKWWFSWITCNKRRVIGNTFRKWHLEKHYLLSVSNEISLIMVTVSLVKVYKSYVKIFWKYIQKHIREEEKEKKKDIVKLFVLHANAKGKVIGKLFLLYALAKDLSWKTSFFVQFQCLLFYRI